MSEILDRLSAAPTTYELFIGDAVEQLRLLPDGYFHCCVTSPPYWGLRDYGVAGQLGLEKTPQDYVSKLVDVFREVRRVMRDDGTLWLNLGDSYCSQGGLHDFRYDNQPNLGCRRVWRDGCGRADGIVDERGQRNRNGVYAIGFKPKDLIGIPWRTAIALQADGWYLRSDIIWQKPNPMPESVTDRPTKSHEYLFLLTKSERYYWDHETMQEPAVQNGRKRSDRFGGTKYVEGVKHSDGSTFTGSETRNRRDVWTIPTVAYKGAHFATFPPDLVRPCILAGCPVGGRVLDPFAGSGTTGQIALELRRHATLIELNPDYAKLIHERCQCTEP